MPAILIQPSAAAGFVSFFGHIAKGAGDTVDLPEGMVNIGGNSKGYMLAAQDNWDPTANSDGTADALTLGDDIYLYAVQPGTGAYADVVASKNSTVPTGYNAGNSRKIGGFHYGRVRPIDKRYDTSFNPPTQIVPNSCWDLQHRPKCDPSGMVEVIPGLLWADIYLNSEGAGNWPENIPVSRFGAQPIVDDIYARADFHQLASNAGKRLPTVEEFLRYAEGCLQGNDNNNDYAWSATNNIGPAATGTVAKAISQYNVVDAAGNVWDWLDAHYDAGFFDTYGYRDDVVDVGQDGARDRGLMYSYNSSSNSGRKDGNEGSSSWRSFLGGGGFVDGARCGARCLSSYAGPWGANGNVGLRCVCDAL